MEVSSKTTDEVSEMLDILKQIKAGKDSEPVSDEVCEHKHTRREFVEDGTVNRTKSRYVGGRNVSVVTVCDKCGYWVSVGGQR